MSCQLLRRRLDERGARFLDETSVQELDDHAGSCAVCRSEHNRRDVARLALEVSVSGAVSDPLEELIRGSLSVLDEAMRRRQQAAGRGRVANLLARWREPWPRPGVRPLE